jgi:type I restriction enzyme S subunit
VARIEALAGRIEEAKRLRHEADEFSATICAVKANEISKRIERVAARRALHEIIESHDSGWSPQCSDEPAQSGCWGVLKTTCVQWSGFHPIQNKALLSSNSPRPELQVRAGDVLITRAGPVNRVGVACHVRKEAPLLMLSDKIVRIRPKASVLSDYLVFELCSPSAQEYFRHGKTGLAESQVNISRDKLLKLPILLPDIPEQQRIVSELNNLQAKVETLRGLQAETAAELDALLPAILDKAFKGEL